MISNYNKTNATWHLHVQVRQKKTLEQVLKHVYS